MMGWYWYQEWWMVFEETLVEAFYIFAKVPSLFYPYDVQISTNFLELIGPN
jgi:hypothetical protein